MITKKSIEYNAGKRQGTITFQAERPQHTLSKDRVMFMDGDTRMYSIGEKTFDADTYDRMFGIGGTKKTVLPKGTKDPNLYFAPGSIKLPTKARRFR